MSDEDARAWLWTDMDDPLHPTEEEKQRERYLPPWAQGLIRELRWMASKERS
jgi:hypothetical protein